MRFSGLTRKLALLGLGLGSFGCSSPSDPAGSAGSGNTPNPANGGSPSGGGSTGTSGSLGQGNEANQGSSTAGTASAQGGSTGQGATSSGGGAPPTRTFMPGAGRGGAFVSLRPSGGAGSLDVCSELNVVSTPQIPTVAIVLDNSSTMYEPADASPSAALLEALMNPTTGAIKPLESAVRFGFATFRSKKGTQLPENDPMCAEFSSVPYGLENYDEINAAYTTVTQDRRGEKGCGASADPNLCASQTRDWDTPTGHALNRVTTDLLAYMPDPPGRKYILFVTDGSPNTCMVSDPDCGQDVALKAVQDAFAAGIGTFVIGVGDLANGKPGSCDRNSVRCGEDHLQDIANAGTGAPVEEPPMSYWYSQCATQGVPNPGEPQATYAPAGSAPGTAKYFTAATPAALRDALAELLNSVISCTVEMDAIVTGNPALGVVTVNSTALKYGDPNGWKLEDDYFSVTLTGTACEAFRDSAPLDIKFPCDPNGNPIAVRR